MVLGESSEVGRRKIREQRPESGWIQSPRGSSGKEKMQFFLWKLRRGLESELDCRTVWSSKGGSWQSSWNKSCYGLNVCVPQKFIYWSPNPQCVSMWRWGLGEVIRFRWSHEGGAPMKGLASLQNRKRPEPSENQEKGSHQIWNPRHLDLGLLDLQKYEK